MSQSLFKPSHYYQSACLFEAALSVVALVLAWLANINPFAQLHFAEMALVYGFFGTIPLFLMFLGLEHLQKPSVQDIKKLLMNSLGAALHRYHWSDLLLLAVIAGFSEELLFRGVIQPWMESAWGMSAGLLVSNLLFGLVHAVTPLYAVLATLVGLYLSLSLDYGGERNLLTPIIIHSLYDFLAFVALMRLYRNSLQTS